MSDRNCDNCNVSYGPDDMFCENCGYDFVTGSLPVDSPRAPVAPQGGAAQAAPPAPSILNADGQGGGVPLNRGGADQGSPSGPAASQGQPSGSTAGPGAGAGPTSGAAGTGAGGGLASGAGVAGQSGGGSSPGMSPDSGGSVAAPDVPRLRVAVVADRAYFEAVVNDGEIDFPDPPPADQELALAGRELHIGRTSESRAIHPDIDVAELTGDQAVSSRHAVLRVANDGSYTIVDVGSTNGTFLDGVDTEAIIHGVPVAVKPGSPIFVGAWTRLTILD